MKSFKNILVGIDLENDGHDAADSLSAATKAAIDNGLWLAKQNGARLVFFNAIEILKYARFLAEKQSDIETTLIAGSEDCLATLSRRAQEEGIDAVHVWAFGNSWVELIRQVLKEEHDLVIVGTRQRGTAASVLLGSTGMKLLRKCPCPVWISKPSGHQRPPSVLVADDLSPVSSVALELGVSMAALHRSPLHVLHVLELGLGRREWDSFDIRQRARAEASEGLRAQLTEVDTACLVEPPHLDIVVDAADTAIIRCIEQLDIDLLVMGTVARGGVPGILMGNTAERLLPRIGCSVIAVKPADFICPMSAE